MEALLKLVHEDFELLVSCNSYDRIYRKAAECMRVEQDSEALLSYYIWDGDKAVLTFRGISIEKGAYVPSVFFENTDYQYWIHFKKQVTEACMASVSMRMRKCFMDTSTMAMILAGQT